MSNKKTMQKISILSISLLAMIAPAVSATVPYIGSDLSTSSSASIGMLMSVPNFGILLCIFISPFINRIIGNKPTVMLGLLIALIAGVIPVFTSSYLILLVSRFLLGCGIGLFNSLAYSLITMNFQGSERDKLLGYQGAVSAFGSTIAALVVGWLMNINWHASYLVYVIAIIPLLLFGFYGPSNNSIESNGAQESSNEKIRLEPCVFYYSILMFFIFAAYMAIVFKLATQVTAVGYASASQASVMLAAMTASGFVSGLIFGKVKNILKDFTLVVGIVGLGISTIIIGLSSNIYLTTIFVLLAGIFSGFINPSVFGEIALASNQASQNAASTCILIGINLGVFLNPSLLSLMGRIFSNESTVFSFIAAGVILLISGLIQLIRNFSTSEKKTERKIKEEQL